MNSNFGVLKTYIDPQYTGEIRESLNNISDLASSDDALNQLNSGEAGKNLVLLFSLLVNSDAFSTTPLLEEYTQKISLKLTDTLLPETIASTFQDALKIQATKNRAHNATQWITHLPGDVLLEIVRYLKNSDLRNTLNTCTQWCGCRPARFVDDTSIMSRIYLDVRPTADQLFLQMFLQKIGQDLLNGLTDLAHRVVSLAFSNTKLTNADLEFIKNTFPQLQKLDIRNCEKITGNGLQHLAGCKNLQELDISLNTVVTDNDLQHLTQLKKLHTLNLINCSITDAGMKYIAQLQNLQELDISHCTEVTGVGLEYLKQLQRLQKLNISNCDKIVYNNGLQHLVAFQNLQTLRLPRNITGHDLECLTKLKQLRNLNINFPKNITNDDLKYLTEITQLETFYISHYNITDKGMSHIAGIKLLKDLDLSGCNNITSNGLKHLITIQSLQTLALNFCPEINDEALKDIAQIPYLQKLDLHSTFITDNGLKHLTALLHLKLLKISHCKQTTEAGLNHFSEMRQLKIVH